MSSRASHGLPAPSASRIWEVHCCRPPTTHKARRTFIFLALVSRHPMLLSRALEEDLQTRGALVETPHCCAGTMGKGRALIVQVSRSLASHPANTAASGMYPQVFHGWTPVNMSAAGLGMNMQGAHAMPQNMLAVNVQGFQIFGPSHTTLGPMRGNRVGSGFNSEGYDTTHSFNVDILPNTAVHALINRSPSVPVRSVVQA